MSRWLLGLSGARRLPHARRPLHTTKKPRRRGCVPQASPGGRVRDHLFLERARGRRGGFFAADPGRPPPMAHFAISWILSRCRPLFVPARET
jgi:hypothetical protein